MRRNFLYLAFVTLFAVLVLWVFVPGGGPTEKLAVDKLLLPEISKHINDVNRFEVVSAGDNTVATLVKTATGWQFEQMGGYRANWEKLQTLLAALAQARVVEPKTDKAEYYARLGVEDINHEDAGSVLVRISIGDQTTGILIGHQAQGGSGQYVRLQGEVASALVDRKLDVPTGQMDWVDLTIVDISASQVAQVEIIHPQAERVFVIRISADQTDFDLVGLPQDREIRSSWAVNSLASVFSMLNLETVQPEDSVDWSDAVKMRMLMFSGVEIIADMVATDNEYWLRLSASHPAAKVVSDQSEDDKGSVEQQEIEKQAAADVATTVRNINQKASGWAYSIKKQKYDAMVVKPEDLLKPGGAQ